MVFVKQDEFKKLLEEALEPIKETQKEHTGILAEHTAVLRGHTTLLKEHTEALETLKSSAVTIENTIPKLTLAEVQ